MGDRIKKMESQSKAIEFKLKAETSEFNRVHIKSTDDAYRYIRQFYHDDIMIYESAFILLLNTKNDTIGYAKISQGGVAGTVVDIKIVCKYAIDSLSSGVIFAHNHPSGNLTPSEADIKLSKKIKEALAVFDIRLLDSMIITDENFFSFMDN